MAKFPRIATPTLDELFDRIPGWSAMPPAEAIAAIGKAAADDLFQQIFAAFADDTKPQT